MPSSRGNKTEWAAHVQRRKRARTAWIGGFKARPCVDCGVQYPSWVMQFDHVRGEKFLGVAQMRNYSDARILAEIAKCEVVCANCHANRTHSRRGK